MEKFNELGIAFPTRFRQSYGKAVAFAESFPFETRIKLFVLRDLEGGNGVDYIVCRVVKETPDDGGFWITSDGFFLSKKRHILAMCEINSNNLKNQQNG
jgi:hypothetical protein